MFEEGLKGPGASQALDGTIAPFAQDSPVPMRCTASCEPAIRTRVNCVVDTQTQHALLTLELPNTMHRIQPPSPDCARPVEQFPD